jgi:hypothetical protein
MRLWTLHPRYLDVQGLVALWREGLLARAVLRGQTRGYRHHPQLDRFRAHGAAISTINAYLLEVHAEASRRGYAFDRSRVGPRRNGASIETTHGQLEYEWAHLLAKLRVRSPALFEQLRAAEPAPHPLFRLRPGPVEAWERR